MAANRSPIFDHSLRISSMPFAWKSLIWDIHCAEKHGKNIHKAAFTLKACFCVHAFACVNALLFACSRSDWHVPWMPYSRSLFTCEMESSQ